MKVNQTDRDLSKLVSPFKEKVEDFLKDDRVSNIFVTEGYRSQERQEYLYNQTPRVTWTLTSMHTKWLAIDIAFNWSELYPSDFELWNSVAKVASEYWIDWGYNLWQTDMPHFQDNGLPYNKNTMNNKYINVLSKEIDETYSPIFNKLTGDETLTEAEVKTLIEISLIRFEEKWKKNFEDLFKWV